MSLTRNVCRSLEKYNKRTGEKKKRAKKILNCRLISLLLLSFFGGISELSILFAQVILGTNSTIWILRLAIRLDA